MKAKPSQVLSQNRVMKRLKGSRETLGRSMTPTNHFLISNKGQQRGSSASAEESLRPPRRAVGDEVNVS